MDLNKAMLRLQESKKEESKKLANLVDSSKSRTKSKRLIKESKAKLLKEDCENCEELGEIPEDLEEGKTLTELRHVDKKVVVTAYDFDELSKDTQENLIRRYFNYRSNKKPNYSQSPEELTKEEVNERFRNELKEKTIFTDCSPYGYLFETDENRLENIYSNMYFYIKCSVSEISDKIKADSDYHDDLNINGSLEGWSDIKSKVLENLNSGTDFSELSKADKKEIISKIDSSIQTAKELIDKYRKIGAEEIEKVNDTNTNYKDLINKPAIEFCKKYWYDKLGNEIIEKSKAKVIDENPTVGESLITEAPVSLEFDQGYDVYSYDDLNDYGKRNAFSSTERSRKNEYEKTFNNLKDKIKEIVNSELSNAGLELNKSSEIDEPIQIRSYEKGFLSSVYVYISSDSLQKYAKKNGIELQPKVETEYGEREPRCNLQMSFDGGRYSRPGFYVSLENINTFKNERGYYYDNEEVIKALKQEIDLDLRGLWRKVSRIEKEFKDAIDDDFRNRMSTDRKLKRREYDSRGNVYKDKKNEK